MNILSKKNFFLILAFYFHTIFCSLTLETNYGFINDCEPVIWDLIKHPAMQRLKLVHQYGIKYFLINDYDYTRFEHSVGVFALLRKFGASLEEQIAGLLHDVSHTAFSHFGDYFFKAESYQDDIHKWFLYESGINKVLEFHGYTVEQVLHKNDTFRCLEQELPDICADRLEYVLYGGYLEKQLSKEDVDNVLSNLKFENNRWYFIDEVVAEKFARTSLYLTEKLSASSDNVASNMLLSQMLHYALDKKFILNYDINFGFDNNIWYQLRFLQDEILQGFFKQFNNLKESYYISDKFDNEALFYRCKFRGIDPWVKINLKFKRLTNINKKYHKAFEDLQKDVLDGWYIHFNYLMESKYRNFLFHISC